MGIFTIIFLLWVLALAVLAVLVLVGKSTAQPKLLQITADNKVILQRAKPPTFLEFYSDALFNMANLNKPGKFPSTGLKHSFELICSDATVSASENAKWNQSAGFEDPNFVHPIMYFSKDIPLIAQLFCQKLWPTRPIVGVIHTNLKVNQKRNIKIGEKVTKVVAILKVDNGNEFEVTSKIYPHGTHEGPGFIAEGVSIFKFPKKGSGNVFLTSPNPLFKLVTFRAKEGKGFEWAHVSGDYNPWHINKHLAKLFGFRSPVLHGYCTLSMATSLVKDIWEPFNGQISINSQWKRPIFMPSSNKIFIRKEEAELKYTLNVKSQNDEHQHIFINIDKLVQ